MGHLSLATERNIDLRIITHGPVVENQKTGAPRDADWGGEERTRQPAGAELYERSHSQAQTVHP